ncbi:MAG: fibronectin type III domain-containing protein, partial [Verrucomicrobia bacterium]
TADNEERFRLQRREAGTTSWTTVAASLPADTTSHVDSSVSASTSYEYRVRAENAAGNSAFSALASVTTPAGGGGGGSGGTPVVLIGWDFTDGTSKDAVGAPSTENDPAVTPASIVPGSAAQYQSNSVWNADGYPLKDVDGSGLESGNYLSWTVAAPGSTLSLTRVRFGLWHGDNTAGVSLGAELRASTDGFASHVVIPLAPNPGTIARSNGSYGSGTEMDLDLSGIAALQNVSSGVVEFRLYLWGLSTQFKSAGLGKLTADGNGPGLVVEGIVAP